MITFILIVVAVIVAGIGTGVWLAEGRRGVALASYGRRHSDYRYR